jgi:insulysin
MATALSKLRFLLGFLWIAIATSSFLQGKEANGSSDYTVIENQAQIPLLTPSMAATKFLKIRLKNGLEAYLVSDPHADKSSAVMTVKVGSWDEPKDYAGLAHFLEHMLFLGTKKYPKESEYNRYITEHGGMTNAFTSDDHTSFLFSIDNPAFEEALDRFSSFFKEPLFNPSGVARELQAIDQEYAKNRENDDVRELFVYKELSNPEHPFHAFNMGNSESLVKVSQDTLKEWYRTHYSANLMRLMVISPLPLDKLKDLVVQDFKDVPTSNRPLLNLDMPIFSKSADGTITYIEPIKNIRTLTLSWDLPARFSHMQQSRPDSIVCYVLGHEGKESLLAELKRESLAEKLSCGSFQLGPNNTQFFIEITLTDQGLKQVYTVIERVFQAIANFKEKGVPRYLFDEVQKVSLMHYQYQEREEPFQTVMKNASWLARENMETFPEQSQLIKKFDPQGVLDLLNFLKPQNGHFDIRAPASLSGIKPDKKETWIGVEYAVRPIPPAVMSSWEKAVSNPAIDLPAPNPFMPDNLSLLNVQLSSETNVPLVPKPEIVVDSDKGKIYFAADNKFLTPQIGWIFDLKTPYIENGHAQKVVLGELFIKFLEEALSPSSYPATAAGLNYEIRLSDNGIRISIDGYSEKAPLLLKEVLQKLKELPINQDLFKLYKDIKQREYQNFSLNSPLIQTSEVLKSVLYKEFTTARQKSAALRKINYEKFTEFAKKLFESIYVQGVMYGNMTDEQAKQMGDLILNHFQESAAYPVEAQPQVKIILLPEKGGPFYLENKISVEGNAALLCLEMPPFSFKNRAAQQILMQAIDEPFFADLRTRQQTGYLVYSAGEEMEKHLFNFFAVQSNTHDPRDLLARFELFIEGYLQELDAELPEERFDKIREALVTNLKTSVRNIKTMAELLHKIAFKYDGDFDWMDERIAGFSNLKYGEFLNLATEFLGKQNKRRLGLLMKGILPENNIFHYTRLSSISQLRKLSSFQTAGED